MITVIGLWAWRSGFRISYGQEIILFKTSRPVLESTRLQLSEHRGSFLGLKRPGREENHSPPSSAAIKN